MLVIVNPGHQPITIIFPYFNHFTIPKATTASLPADGSIGGATNESIAVVIVAMVRRAEIPKPLLARAYCSLVWSASDEATRAACHTEIGVSSWTFPALVGGRLLRLIYGRLLRV
jgi:hypothetical protein